MRLAIEVLRTDTGERQTFSCASSPVRVGRSPLNNVVLNVPWVSLHHGLIHFDGDRASYSDLGSTNGTLLLVKDQEMKLHPMVPVQILGAGGGRAELRVGAITLRVTREGDAAQPEGTGQSSADQRRSKRDLGTRLTAGEMRVVDDEAPRGGGRAPAGTVLGTGGQPLPGTGAPDPARAATGVPDPRAAYAAGATRFASRPELPAVTDQPPAEPAPPRRPSLPPTGVPAVQPAGGRTGAKAPMYNAGATRVVPGALEAMGLPTPPAGQGPAPSAPMVDRPSGAFPPGRGGEGEPPGALARVSAAWAAAAGQRADLQVADRAFVETLAAVADAFARGLVELQKGLKEFGEGIGVRAVGSHSPLHRARTSDEVLSYLLDPNADTHERLEQLVDLFADLMIHEVALLNGVKAGVRALVSELDPATFRQSDAGKSLGLFDKSLRRYEDHFKAATEDEGESVVFGQHFARAYADALGGDESGVRRRG